MIITHANNASNVEKLSHSARVAGPPNRGRPPSHNDANLNSWNSWNSWDNNANNNVTQRNIWAINSVLRAFEKSSTAGFGNESNAASFGWDRGQKP